MVCYLNGNLHRIFMVHCYVRPNGEIGASGLPDPEWLFEDGAVYRAASSE